MFERLEAIEAKYNELQKDLTNPLIMSDYNKVRALSKEASDLESTVKKYEEYKNIEKEIEDAKILMKDDELKEMATLELENLKAKEEQIKKLQEEIAILKKKLEILDKSDKSTIQQ